MINLMSGGGVGDLSIILCKIGNRFKLNEVNLTHYEAHQQYQKPIQDILNNVLPSSKCIITEKQKLYDILNEPGYINTDISKEESPYLKFKIGYEIRFNKPRIVINTNSGRSNDSSTRIVSNVLIEQVKKTFKNHSIVLIGSNKRDWPEDKQVINLTGYHASIVDSLSYINDACLTIGQDGIFTYYSMLLGKYTIINYHSPSLQSTYWNDSWSDHTIAFNGTNNMNELPNINIMKSFINEVINSE